MSLGLSSTSPTIFSFHEPASVPENEYDIAITASSTHPTTGLYHSAASSVVGTQPPAAAVARDSNNSDPNSDTDADMSDGGGGGGVALTTSVSHEHVAPETAEDAVDTANANVYSIAPIATTTTIEAVLDDLDHESHAEVVEPSTEHNIPLQQPLAIGPTNDELGDHEDDHVAHVHASVTADMNHVTAHLQAIQGQQMGDDNDAINLHDGVPITQCGYACDYALYDWKTTWRISMIIKSRANHIQVEDPRNLSLGDFLYTWAMADFHRNSTSSKKRKRCPNIDYLETMNTKKIREVRSADLRNEKCDFQGIDWEKLEVSRSDGRLVRKRTYRSYQNLDCPKYHTEALRYQKIDSSQNYFQFRRMDLAHRPHFAHFQLRNLIACTSQNSVYYAGRAKVYQSRPLFNTKHCAMDLTDPYVIPASPLGDGEPGISIATLAAGHGVLMVGGYAGEYAMRSTNTSDTVHTEGIVTNSPDNPLINHVDIIQNRHSYTPQAVFSCNDKGLRILNTETEKLVHEKFFDWPINCTVTSPDARLRALVGDDRNVLIVNAETSQILQSLSGHSDYGFACAWADNGYHLATANQDKMVKIWDARMWTNTSGDGKPIATISSHLAAVRSLKFSPSGSGKRVLVAAEQADVISIIDAETYSTKQHLDFFGEILGTDFSPDGQGLVVGISDQLRGGIMEFERCAHGESYSSRRLIWTRAENAYRKRDDIDLCWETNDYGELESTNADNAWDSMDAGLDWKGSIDQSVAAGSANRTATWYRRRAGMAGDAMPSL